MTTLGVLEPGFQSTVQDLGRPGFAHLGISASGAADALALRLGNLAVGNDEGAAAIEMTLVGAALEFDAPATIAITGSDFGPRLAGRAVPLWEPIDVRAGQRLELGPSRSGARCYLCIRGGIVVPPVLGSASTHLVTRLGGLHGRRLEAGDRLPVGRAEHTDPMGFDKRWIASLRGRGPLRMTLGPQSTWFADGMTERLTGSRYTVLEQSNRMGVRLTGPDLRLREPRPLLTEGVSLGAIQVPASGQPIILFVEHQTTGGYPKIANICSADLDRVGQLRPRDVVRFELVSLEDARNTYLRIEESVARVTGHRPASGESPA